MIFRGLRGRITLLTMLVTAVVSVILLVLAWNLVADSVASIPALPRGTKVQVGGRPVDPAALNTRLRDQAREHVLVVGLIAFTLMVAAAGIVAWTLTARVLKPLSDITATAQRLSAESLDERIGQLTPRDELARLAETLDAMLDRLSEAFDGQRRFVANASHELRTPLTVIRTELDVTLSDENASAEELRRMATVVRDATLRAERLVGALLLLAKTDATGLAIHEPVDLAAIVDRAWQAVRDDAADRGLEVTFDTPQAGAVGDPALLERVAGNLVENAVKHNVEGGWIEIRTRALESHSTLTVRSSGPLIDPDTVSSLFEPFRRSGTARTARSGAGLGLSIVRAAIEAHDGSVQAEPVVGGGLAVTVTLNNR